MRPSNVTRLSFHSIDGGFAKLMHGDPRARWVLLVNPPPPPTPGPAVPLEQWIAWAPASPLFTPAAPLRFPLRDGMRPIPLREGGWIIRADRVGADVIAVTETKDPYHHFSVERVRAGRRITFEIPRPIHAGESGDWLGGHLRILAEFDLMNEEERQQYQAATRDAQRLMALATADLAVATLTAERRSRARPRLRVVV